MRSENFPCINISPSINRIWKAFPCHVALIANYRFPEAPLRISIQKKSFLQISFAKTYALLEGGYGKPSLGIWSIWQTIISQRRL